MSEADQTEFSGDWLALREPADLAARDAGILDRVRALLADIESPTIVDLAAGRGSTIAALDADNALGARWHLLDQDPALLGAAAARFAGHRIATGRCDLRDLVLSHQRFGDLVPAAADLVTLSAFTDLASLEWLAQFALRCAERELPVYCALTIDGRVDLSPADPADGAILSALADHERSDKGFGPALGPTAPQAFAAAFGRAGYVVAQAPADWMLDRGDAALAAALIEGWAGAVGETGTVPASEIARWLGARREAIAKGMLRVSVGHQDALATRPQRDVTKL